MSEAWLWDEMERAADEFRRVPCAYRPVVTSRDALVSAERECLDPGCPICQRGPR